MALPQNILVATDFGGPADVALDYAVELAKRLGASLTVLHAYTIPVYAFPDGGMISTPTLAAELATRGQSALDAAVARHRNAGVPIKALLREGVVWEEIVRTAEQEGAGLIVMGTHGRTGLSHALLGSVAEKVVRTAKRPVLTIPPPA